MSVPSPEQSQRPPAVGHQSGGADQHSWTAIDRDAPSERLQHALARDARCDARGAFRVFGAPKDFRNRTVIDLGSERGETSFESLRRNAGRVIGYQPSRDRAHHCQTTAVSLGFADRCEFREMDLRATLQSSGEIARFVRSCEQADVVFCSVGKFDDTALSELLAELTAEVCYLESTSHATVSSAMQHATSVGFASAAPIGRYRTRSGEHRHGLTLDKKILLSERSEQRRYRGYRFGERFLKGLSSRALWDWYSRRYITTDSRYDHRTYRLRDRYIRDFASIELWEKVRGLYARIAHIPYVQDCDFSVPGRLTSPIYAQNLAQVKLTQDQKDDVRRQVVLLIRQLNQAGVAHRDLHCGNFFLDQGQIRLVDLEFLEADPQPLGECYDLTGEGLASPLRSGHMNAFKDFALSLSNVIGLMPQDFGLLEVADHTGRTSRAAA